MITIEDFMKSVENDTVLYFVEPEGISKRKAKNLGLIYNEKSFSCFSIHPLTTSSSFPFDKIFKSQEEAARALIENIKTRYNLS